MAFDDLYQEIILDHYRNPHNFGEIQRSCTIVEEDNPTCGDQIKLSLWVDENKTIQDIKFSGQGCAISIASASIMTETVKGKTTDVAKEIADTIITTMRGEGEPDVLDEYGDLIALKGVIQFPARVKCATLAWHALEEALQKAEAGE